MKGGKLFMQIILAFIISLSLVSAVPVLYFSDLESGPKIDNTDTSLGQVAGQDGAIVTIWGENLGSSQGNSKVFVNGAEAQVYYWGNAEKPANLYKSHGMQKISFQINHAANDGLGEIYAVVDGIQSNSIQFTVRAGNIYFVKTNGNDNTGTGSWQSPWKTIIKCKSSLASGDICYIGNGVSQTTIDDYGACVNLNSHGQEGMPKALVAYPGAIVNVGSDSIGRAFHNWVSGCNPSCSGAYWVISQFNITAGERGVFSTTGYRIIGNYFTGPLASGQSGIIEGGGNNVRILGNEFYDVGNPSGTKLYHVVYISGVRTGTAPRAETESDREIGWNYFHDNKANRAINIYSEQAYSAFIENHKVHDNYIINQRGDGILIGYYVTGENWVYNNIVINSGLGPDWGDGISTHAGIHIAAGHSETTTTIYYYNNILYGNGDSNAASGENGQTYIEQAALDRSTIYFKNNLIYSLDSADKYEANLGGDPPIGAYHNLWYGQGSAPSWDTAAINANPLFVDATNNNFHLQSSSPAIDAGIDASAIAARDFDGNSRPQGNGFDIGAYEYASGAQQYHPADINQNNKIEMTELIAFIGLWKQGTSSVNDVLSALDRWFRGS